MSELSSKQVKSKLLWEADQKIKEEASMWSFLQLINQKYAKSFKEYKELHTWSIENKEDFWKEIILYFNLEVEGSLDDFQANDFLNYSWFPQVKLNFAQNLLKRRDQAVAFDFFHESGFESKISYKELYREVAELQFELKNWVSEDDVVACLMPNTPHTAVTMLATTALGGIFTSTSCDFGVNGVVDRFGQSKPKVLVTALYYEYNGKNFDLRDRIREIKEQVPSIEKVIVVDFLNRNEEIPNDYISWESIINCNDGQKSETKEVQFVSRRFSDPLYIMYSSGTTGKPKCIIHSTGGVLLQHVKELGLHCNLNKNKSIFYFTTCGWMMWNWLISSLALGAKIGLYEGSPGFPSLKGFFKKLDEKKFEIIGLSPKFLKAMEMDSYDKDFSFEKLEVLLSTGAPLIDEQFDFVYDKIKKDTQLSSISGGTDIIGCFMLGNPLLPVRRGEIQGLGLGMDVAAFDGDGKVSFGEEGELVCRQSFPSQPIGFLNDENNDRFKQAYFSVYKNIWHHGDFITIEKSGGVKVHGRSDATLNPGGVRIGTAEIYRQTETLDFLKDSLAVGKEIEGDIEIWLFVQMNEGEELDNEKIKLIKRTIRSKTTPRHTPSNVLQVSGIPYTRSGKKMEILVNRLINGKEIKNLEAVSNPECLDQYTNENL